jgi:hypothetical protein
VLLDALEQAGHQVDWPAPHKEPLKVTVLGEFLPLLLSEVLERTAHKLTRSEALRQKREPWWRAPSWDYEPSGHLVLTIEYGESLGVRRSSSDGKKKRIEDILGQFLLSVEAVAKALKRQREEQAEQEGVPEEQRQDIRAMAEWAMRHAGYVDPFTHLAWMIHQFKEPPWSYGS